MLLGKDEMRPRRARIGGVPREVDLGESPLAVKGDIVVHAPCYGAPCPDALM